jgi:hypothetical protein
MQRQVFFFVTGSNVRSEKMSKIWPKGLPDFCIG